MPLPTFSAPSRCCESTWTLSASLSVSNSTLEVMVVRRARIVPGKEMGDVVEIWEPSKRARAVFSAGDRREVSRESRVGNVAGRVGIDSSLVGGLRSVSQVCRSVWSLDGD